MNLKRLLLRTVVLLFLLANSFFGLTQQKIKHVFLIGVDGMGAYAWKKAEIPVMRNIMKQGSWSLNARSVLPSSSAANWASMLMGAGPELHGFTTWGSKKPDLPSRELDKYGMFPTIFSLLREQNPKAEIGVIYEWDGIGYLFPKAAVDHDQNCDSDSILTIETIKYIEKKKPTLLFVHLHDVDSVGHMVGHDTKEYYASIERTDQNIGKIIESIKKAGILNESIILISADHGGINKGHGEKTMAEMEIPWIIMGPGIKKDNAISESIMTFDTAATIMALLQIKPPQSWIGRPVRSAFNKNGSLKNKN